LCSASSLQLQGAPAEAVEATQWIGNGQLADIQAKDVLGEDGANCVRFFEVVLLIGLP
jgi:hypothetical protein